MGSSNQMQNTCLFSNYIIPLTTSKVKVRARENAYMHVPGAHRLNIAYLIGGNFAGENFRGGNVSSLVIKTTGNN